MRTLLLSCVLLAGVVRADSVGVYAPAILPGVTLADNVWQKYEPAAFGSNTTARIQAFYDMMCERVDVMDPNYTTWDSYAGEPIDKTLVSYPGCPSPSARAAATNSVFPSVDQYRTLYTNMCAWLRRNPAVTPAATENDGIYLYPYWQSPLCHDIALSVTTNGITSQNTDVYPCSLNRFGYVGVERHDISNALQSVARVLNLPYTAGTNGVTASDLDNTFCRFVDPDTGAAKYVDEVLPADATNVHALSWAPLYAFDRICNDLSSRNVSILRLSAANYQVDAESKELTCSYNYDYDAIAERVLEISQGLSAGAVSTFTAAPTSLTVTVSSSSSTTANNIRAAVGATVYSKTAARGVVASYGDSRYVSFTSYPALTLAGLSVSSSLGESTLEPLCGPSGLLERPDYLSRSRVTAVGSFREESAALGRSDLYMTNAYFTVVTTTNALLGDASRLIASNAFTFSDEELSQLMDGIRESIPLIVTVSPTSFTSTFGSGTTPYASIVRNYTLPYLICENEYAFTGWSGHVAQPTDPLTVVGPQADYGDGDGGTDDFDVWVDATALASNADGSRERPFLTLDAAIEAVNPSGGAHAVTNRTPKIGIRKGTYEFPQYFHRTSGANTPYAVRLIGIGDKVTLTHSRRGQCGRGITFERKSWLENLNIICSRETTGYGTAFTCFIILNCKITGRFQNSWFPFMEGGYVGNTLFTDLSVNILGSGGTYAFIYGCNVENCLINEVNEGTTRRLTLCERASFYNTLVVGGQWRDIGKGAEHEFIASTLYLPDVTTKTQPTATNCLFFIDGLTTTEDFRKHNVVTNAALFATAIDQTTKTPTSEYSGWRKLGFQGNERSE